MMAMLKGTPNDPKLSEQAVEEVSEHFEKIRVQKKIKYDKIVDETVLIHQIPGGMTSRLMN